MNKLIVNNMHKYYGKRGNVTKAVDNISFSVENGEFIGIMGASGSGKTTLLNCISTIDTVTSGDIIIEDRNITELSQKKLAEFRCNNLGFIFQDFNLLDTLTAYENIALALSIKNEKASEIEKKVKEVANILEITMVLDKYPYEMSGGQKQRVAAARAMVTEPKLILADEPTGALDSKSARRLMESIEKLNNTKDATILLVTHDAYSASFCNRILFLKDGKIFNEIVKGTNTRKEFFDRIIEVVSLLGGELNDL